MVRGTLSVLAVAATLLSGCPRFAPPPVATPAPRKVIVAAPNPPPLVAGQGQPRDASDELFEQAAARTIKIELSPQQEQLLREDARRYVRAKLIENGETEYPDVAIKLKGAAGSFQDLDAKPGFTLNASKFIKDQRFHALDKFHLNNSVQDESYLNEALAGELCRDAGLPAARVTHARVWLNDRDLGLYVLKEGFDQGFLKRHFRDPSGNLYDGGFCIDIDAELEKDGGSGPNDLADLKALLQACQAEEPAERWTQISQQLDVDAFINFMALELMMCHWDGYTANKNNYRIYFDPATKQARFLPHGMDQMFQDPGFPIWLQPGSIVAAAAMHNPPWRERYQERVKELLPQFSADALQAKVDALDKRLLPTFKTLGSEAEQQHAEAVRQLKERLAARAAVLREQIAQPDPGPNPEPAPQEFNEEGVAELPDWQQHEAGDGKLADVETDGKVEFLIEAGPSGECLASWRRRVLLSPGKYRLEARLRTIGVEPLADEKGRGAGLRISGSNRENQLAGDSDWQDIAYEFAVDDERNEVELVAELRASKGQLWIESPLRLRKIE
jgi:hypothetical protein